MPSSPAEFRKGIEETINRCSMENGSNTPDFILAKFLCACLAAFDAGVSERETWYGRSDRPGHGEVSAAPAAPPTPAQPPTERRLASGEHGSQSRCGLLFASSTSQVLATAARVQHESECQKCATLPSVPPREGTPPRPTPAEVQEIAAQVKEDYATASAEARELGRRLDEESERRETTHVYEPIIRRGRPVCGVCGRRFLDNLHPATPPSSIPPGERET